MFARFAEKQSELTQLADTEHKPLKHEREKEVQAAEHRELMKQLVTRTAPQQQQQLCQQQSYNRAVVARPPQGSVGGCR